jgi:signal transduction histidine kinase
MDRTYLLLVFFVYGLAFFSMGLIVLIEVGRGSDERLAQDLRPLAVFGIIHGIHEWLEVFILMDALPFGEGADLFWVSIRIALLAFSFLSLSAFGGALLSTTPNIRRLSLLLPLGQAALWGFGALILRGQFTVEAGLWDIVDVWSRYVLGIPSSLLACGGLIAQQRTFRRAGMARFGRDSLWAAIAFAWYGLIGQIFTRKTLLPPSTVLNQELFQIYFGFPVQLLRALAAAAASVFVVRFLRSFEVERQNQIAALQAVRLKEAERREQLRRDLLGRVVGAQEAERQRVARELHDETGQALTAIGLGLRGIENSLKDETMPAAAHLRQLEGMVSQSLNELQRLIADLRPSHLDDLGLSAALRWYANEVVDRTGLVGDVEQIGEERSLSDPVKIALFRVVQEALTNVLKHAQASRARVGLTFNEENVKILVEDDGRGFNAEQVFKQHRSSWGLMGIEERASLLGGWVEIDSAVWKGTRILVAIPYAPESKIELDEIEDENQITAR